MSLLLNLGRSRTLRQRAFSLAEVLLVLLVGMVGAGSLALRNASGESGGLELSARRQAQETAESGVTAIIGELNKPENRKLLVSATNLESWGSQTDPIQRNPCKQLGSTVAVPPRTTAAAAGSNTWTTAWQAGGATGQYILGRVRHSNFNRQRTSTISYPTAGSGTTSTIVNTTNPYNSSLVNLDPVASGSGNIGFIQLEVQGRVLRNNQTVATSTVVKEYEVIPKCCNRSFSGPANTAGTPTYSFGNDQGTCFGNIGNLGLLFGFNNGDLTAPNNAGTLTKIVVDASGAVTGVAPLESLICITTTSAGSNCADPNLIAADPQDVPVIPAFFDFDPPPTIGVSVPSAGTINTADAVYLRVNPLNTNQMQRCTYSGNTLNNDCTSISTGASRYCERAASGSAASLVAEFHCRMNRIRITGSSPMIIDTSRATIAFFFDGPPASGGGTISIGGNAGLSHRFCTNPPGGSATGGPVCTFPAEPIHFTRLSIFGSQNHNSFDYQGTSVLNGIFIYFLNGTVSFSGNSSSVGSIWTKNLNLGGNFTSSTPATSCTTDSSGFCYILRGSLPGGTGGASALFFDWVARSPVTTRVY